MKIIFISHSYPPILGGIENQNFNLVTGLEKIDQVKIKVISNQKGKWFLPFFLPWAFLKTFFLLGSYDACLFGSGVTTPIGRVLRFFHPRKKFFSVIHGLDVTFANKKGLLAKTYKAINIPSIISMNKLFMVGNATIEEATRVGIPRKKCVFIPNGVDFETLKSDGNRGDMEKIFGKKLAGKKLILRLGRFVPHKGTSWFIENIMPRLPENISLVAV
ncbi:MAG TPA: glycosyltransferase family 4 protein, partial [Candidatus Moranbacteria bacterium]|nr:glycosyltransferase family 4 protein [Candidatus Moranbacteria bacterium]